MNWMLDILVTHKRLRGLSEQQLRDLIEVLDDVKSLRTVKEFLELGSFRYQHIEHAAPELIERCIERAKESLWKQNEQKAREAFLESVGDPFALPM